MLPPPPGLNQSSNYLARENTDASSDAVVIKDYDLIALIDMTENSNYQEPIYRSSYVVARKVAVII